MALTAWQSGLVDVSFGPLYELVDWPTSQSHVTEDGDFEAVANLAVRLSDAASHGAPPLKGLPLPKAMVELEENAGRLERGEALTPYAQSFRP